MFQHTDKHFWLRINIASDNNSLNPINVIWNYTLTVKWGVHFYRVTFAKPGIENITILMLSL